MIYLRLAGGLGNQLFQVAAATLVSSWLRQQVSILDVGLSRYKFSRQSLFHHILKPRSSAWRCSPCSLFSLLLADRLRLGRLPIPFVSINDSNINQVLCSLSLPFPRFMDGYFQKLWTPDSFSESLSLFDIAPIMQHHFSDVHDYVAVHIRGGDFLSEQGFAIVDHEFYLKCFEQAVARGFDHFVVLTDDTCYVQSILPSITSAFPAVTISVAASSSVLEDFNIIRSAPARIIGNSTFAWWATALSSGGPTWSTPYFVADRRKPFLLPGEVFVS
jgi:hypothetical protein